MQAGNALLSCENKLISTRIAEWLSKYSSPPVTLPRGALDDGGVEHIHEFDECHYCLQSGRSTSSAGASTSGVPTLRLSISLPALHTPAAPPAASPAGGGPSLLENARERLGAAYKGIARLVPPPDGFQLCLELDGHMLSQISPADQRYWARNLASMRLIIAGGPLRRHFASLERGEATAGGVEMQSSRRGSAYFIQPHSDSVSVIYPMRFVGLQDAAIGIAFLQEFQTVRSGEASLGMSPSCSYSAKAPACVADFDAGTPVNGGWLVLTVHRRHVVGPQLEHVLWTLVTLQTWVALHVKSCKSMLHAHMRRNADALLDKIDAARDDVLAAAMDAADLALPAAPRPAAPAAAPGPPHAAGADASAGLVVTASSEASAAGASLGDPRRRQA